MWYSIENHPSAALALDRMGSEFSNNLHWRFSSLNGAIGRMSEAILFKQHEYMPNKIIIGSAPLFTSAITHNSYQPITKEEINLQKRVENLSPIPQVAYAMYLCEMFETLKLKTPPEIAIWTTISERKASGVSLEDLQNICENVGISHINKDSKNVAIDFLNFLESGEQPSFKNTKPNTRTNREPVD